MIDIDRRRTDHVDGGSETGHTKLKEFIRCHPIQQCTEKNADGLAFALASFSFCIWAKTVPALYQLPLLGSGSS